MFFMFSQYQASAVRWIATNKRMRTRIRLLATLPTFFFSKFLSLGIQMHEKAEYEELK